MSLLKKALDQRNKALASLHEAMDVSCALLSGPEGARPISCTITTGWSRLHLQDMLTATCQLYNSSHFHLDQGWTLCVQVFSCSSALALDSVSSAITYTVPIPQLGPSGRREVTLPLGPNESGELDLPMTVSCALFYSLREVLGEALASEDALEEPCPAAGPLAVLREQGGVCLPLSRHMVDMLQCLRFPGLPAAPSLLGPGPDPVDTFLESCQRAGKLAGPASLRAKYLPPSVASIKVSAELLRTALQAGGVGQWRYGSAVAQSWRTGHPSPCRPCGAAGGSGPPSPRDDPLACPRCHYSGRWHCSCVRCHRHGSWS